MQSHAHAIHASIGGKGIGVAPGELADAYESVDIYVQPGQGGKGWWSTLSDAVEKGAKEIQSSSVVRGLEKKAVGAAQKYGTKALQGLADSALAETGIGEALAPLANRAIASGTKRLESWADRATSRRRSSSAAPSSTRTPRLYTRQLWRAQSRGGQKNNLFNNQPLP